MLRLSVAGAEENQPLLLPLTKLQCSKKTRKWLGFYQKKGGAERNHGNLFRLVRRLS